VGGCPPSVLPKQLSDELRRHSGDLSRKLTPGLSGDLPSGLPPDLLRVKLSCLPSGLSGDALSGLSPVQPSDLPPAPRSGLLPELLRRLLRGPPPGLSRRLLSRPAGTAVIPPDSRSASRRALRPARRTGQRLRPQNRCWDNHGGRRERREGEARSPASVASVRSVVQCRIQGLGASLTWSPTGLPCLRTRRGPRPMPVGRRPMTRFRVHDSLGGALTDLRRLIGAFAGRQK
jgi:hypothetical protein